MKRFDIVTIFPNMIDSYAKESILGRAQKPRKAGSGSVEKKLIEIRSHDLRKWTTDKHKTVDDTPYGGGAGMVMKVEPFDKAVKSIKKKGKRTRVIVTSASGKKFGHKDAKRLAKYDQVIFLCGRYEGIDHRVEEKLADESLSIGDYVLTGGELPALVMIDSIARQIPGVLGSKESLYEESHATEGLLEYPQYTKPETYFPPARGGVKGGGSKGWKVPEILLSGDHKKIAEWRCKNQKKQK